MNNLTDRLRVSALPLDIIPGDRNANLLAVEESMKALPPATDVVVLPELFSTGYSENAQEMAGLAEKNTGATIDFLKELAQRHSTAIAGSFAACTHPHIYNRGFFIEPGGDETFYDKRHLFSMGSESAVFAPGRDRLKTIRFRGWNIALAICYDLRFPVWCRSRSNEYDLLLVVSNWPQARAYAFEHLLIARAIENQSYIVGANRGGSDKYGEYTGLTKIYDYKGRETGEAEGCFVSADLSLVKLKEFRKAFPVSADADRFTIAGF